jgi:hypothetical protein
MLISSSVPHKTLHLDRIIVAKMSVQPLSSSQDTNDGSLDFSNVSYIEGFDDPNANVVLMGSDKIALRVHDYFLKAAR